MEEHSYIISFDNVSPAIASRYAEELRNAVLDATPDVKVQKGRSDPQAMDFGASLIIILGTPTAVIVAKAIGDWLKLRSSASLTFKKKSGEEVILQNVSSKDVPRIIQILQQGNEE